jgi:predicted nuclease of predicted toxin-antitoxin system
MKVLCDVHISYKLVKFLNENGVEAIHVNDILDRWFTKDKDICKYADENDYVIITKDVDFRNSYFLQNTPKKLIRVTLGNIGNKELIEIFNKNLEEIKNKFESYHCYIEIGKGNISIVIKK